MKFTYPFIFSFLISLFISCDKRDKEADRTIQLSDFATWRNDDYMLSSEKIKQHIDMLCHKRLKMYTDETVRNYYKEGNTFLWVYPGGVSEQADTLLKYLTSVTQEGLPENVLKANLLRQQMDKIRTLDFEKDDINKVYAETEYLLTTALLRYTCGERFGYIRPDILFNRLEKADDKPKTPFTRLYDIQTERADSLFIKQSLDAVKEKGFDQYLLSVRSQNPLFHHLKSIYKDTTDSLYRKKIIANMERFRWQTEELGKKYIFVNLAAMQLQAINHHDGDTLEMRICGGTLKHKSPMLNSHIERIDMNPYWNIPFSIIKKEIAPAHAQDSAYFARNNYRILEKRSGKELNPKDVTRKMLLSGDYRIRQDNGEGNSLGRLILRFPNNFAVYLHDTNNKSAFRREKRMVSHGCIRVEQPLELAIFVLDKPEDEDIDKIRTAIGLPPLSEDFEQDTTDTAEIKMEIMHVKPTVPVIISYFTLYPDIHGKWQSHPDLYGYDKVILEKLATY